ncbi:hypothetical protein CWB97_11225 [Pseudoalteromonas citrea]|uniref:Uncharacterized protein n=1 Tax=Pseudoalteromonas citrea TaxID=43655 RepID=A0ABY2WA40_9GAMM|nr:hypothetical protein CWB97_11225 [Pseudoalteromonas citrea]
MPINKDILLQNSAILCIKMYLLLFLLIISRYFTYLAFLLSYLVSYKVNNALIFYWYFCIDFYNV